MRETDEIFLKLSNELKTRFDLILEICHSPIEKIFIGQLYHFFYVRRLPISILSHDAETLIVEKAVNAVSYDPAHEFYKSNLKVGFYNHPLYGLLEKINGLFIAGIDVNYKIFPQKPIYNHERLVYADFTIILTDKTLKEIGKFAIECDGFEWHSTRDQLIRDNERNRFLTSHGYKIIRYTGSEINRFTDNDILELENLMYRSVYNKESSIYQWEKY